MREIQAAKRRVTLFTMIITHDEATDAFIDALCAAAERGVEVRVSGDIYTFGVMVAETDGGWLSNAGIKATKQMRRRLVASGVKFKWIGELGPLLYARRTHLKWCIVDDTVFSFGGVNLYDNGINHVDFMVSMKDKALADKLEAEHQRIHESERTGRRYHSHSFDCTVGTVLVDGGMFGGSAIYRRACELTEQASRVVLVSQYQPSGKLATLLHQTKSKLYFNQWQKASGANKFLLRTSATFKRQRNSYRRKGYLHAKFMLFYMPDGSTVALTGSHNFVHGGVLLGTREIALETRDPQLVRQIEAYFTK
ncbi:hypothetical protein KDA14_05875, partial [Candidatus Saccharibacteria bacterium]|nr:hypothetical protein [Candidatus Saccharibacteria bacterium]